MECLQSLGPGTGTVLAGAIAAVVASLSWLGKSAVAGFLWYFGRRSREIERMIALRAEIRSNLEFQQNLAGEKTLKSMVESLQANPRHKFFIPLYRENVVFDRLKSDITDLPAEPIGALIHYYNLSSGLDVILERMEGRRYELFAGDRRIKVAEAVSSVAKQTMDAGNSAIAALEKQLHTSIVQKYFLLGLACLVVVIGVKLAWNLVDPLQQLLSSCLMRKAS